MDFIARNARGAIIPVVLGLGLALAAPAGAADPPAPQTTMQTLLDRILIEDLVTSYYSNLGGGGHGFSDYYTDDAVFDLCGKIYKGKDGIEQSYKDLGGTNPIPRGTFHMMLTNPQISVTGDTAVATFIWTGILNEQVKAPPRFIEQGREYDRLVKRNGQWRISYRAVIADSGLPDFCDASHTPRKDYKLPPAQ
jgi:ketosteroid isomerase-like protein